MIRSRPYLAGCAPCATVPAVLSRGAGGWRNGGSLTIYITLTGVDEYFATVSPRAKVEAQLETKFYGMREFAVLDPDGCVLTFAEEKR